MSKPPKYTVYLSCRGIFTDAHTRIRKPKAIQKRLEACKHLLQPLLTNYQLDAIVAVAGLLLEEGIFESPVLAQEAFPTMFVAQGIERKILEVETTKSEAKAVEWAAAEDDRESDANREPNTAKDYSTGPGSNAVTTSLVTGMTLIPSLYPVYLPYKTQHQVLTKVQSILEESCFTFATTLLPEAVSAKGWECPEAAELTQWIKLLQPCEAEIVASAISKRPGRSWQEVLIATSKIRHSSVHRLRTSAKGIQNMIGDALSLTTMLRDTTRTSLLEQISQELESSIKEVEGRLVLLEKNLSEDLDLLSKRRAELDRIQDAAILRVIDHDRENRRVIGLALEEELSELCSKDQKGPGKHISNSNWVKVEASKENASAMGGPVKKMLEIDLCGESKRANGMEQVGN